MELKPSGPSAELANNDTVVPLAGKVLAERYLLERKVGQGGMGAIYEAKDQRLGRKVAIKLMLDTSAGFAQRFEREARAASRINHPNCVAVHDFGTGEQGNYLVMEWVEGRSLAGLVAEEGGLSPARAGELMAQVCDGLSAAHAVGVIHRDVKPENVMVHVRPDGREVAKLVDFGIARVTDSTEPKLTQTGSFIGSPLYMSPEQALALELDQRSDVYSAGATLFFALAARPPYGGEGSSVMMQVLNAEPPALPSPLDGGPLAPVIRRAMAKRREERYATATELAQAIRQAGDAEMQGPSRRRALPRKVVLGLGAGALALAAGAAVIGLRDPARGEAARPEPVASERPAKAQEPAPAPRPTPAPAPVEAAPAAPQESVPGLAEARRLAAAGRRDQALAALKRLRARYPNNAEVPYLQGQANFSNYRWIDGLAAYREAIRIDPGLRSDPALIQDLIRCLDSDRYHRDCASFLRQEIGAPAVSHLNEAAGTHPLENVRIRARRLTSQIERRAGH